jgi:hypothetical protein
MSLGKGKENGKGQRERKEAMSVYFSFNFGKVTLLTFSLLPTHSFLFFLACCYQLPYTALCSSTVVCVFPVD